MLLVPRKTPSVATLLGQLPQKRDAPCSLSLSTVGLCMHLDQLLIATEVVLTRPGRSPGAHRVIQRLLRCSRIVDSCLLLILKGGVTKLFDQVASSATPSIHQAMTLPTGFSTTLSNPMGICLVLLDLVVTPATDLQYVRHQTSTKSASPISGEPRSFVNSPPSPHPLFLPFSLKNRIPCFMLYMNSCLLRASRFAAFLL